MAVEFNVIDIMRDFKWTFQEYLQRPHWFDSYYAIKLEAEAEWHKKQTEDAQKQQ